MNIAICDENRVIKNVIVLDWIPEPVDDDFLLSVLHGVGLVIQ